MANMKNLTNTKNLTGAGISVVVTIKNDEAGVIRLIDALARQTVRPDEVVVVGAGKIEKRDRDREEIGKGGMKMRTISSVGCSRGRGRNIGVTVAKNDLIAVTDAGCLPHRDWLKRLIAPVKRADLRTDRAFYCAGFYRSVAKTPLERAFAVYLGVDWSPRYLPASRSIAFSKSAWAAVGGYPERGRSGGEDLSFAWKLSRLPGVIRYDAPDALVDWQVPGGLRAFFIDVVKHTRGNFEVRYWPHMARNLMVVARWFLFLVFPVLLPFYLCWPIWKHRRAPVPWYFLPIVQLAADMGVLSGVILVLK